jgi:hypothetical protein
MERKDTLDADAVGNFAHGKVRAITTAVNLDDEAFEGLDALLFALDDADLEADGIAHAKERQVGAQRAVFDLLNNAVHGSNTPEVEPLNLSNRPRRLNPFPCLGVLEGHHYGTTIEHVSLRAIDNFR